MCFDICTINIRVSIRVRGLHLVLCFFLLGDIASPRIVAMASDNLEDVLTKSRVDSNLTNSLMMEGWTSQTFHMAAADSQGFEDVLQEWSSSHTLSTLQKACLRTAFQSLQPQQGTSASAFPTPAVSATTVCVCRIEAVHAAPALTFFACPAAATKCPSSTA